MEGARPAPEAVGEPRLEEERGPALIGEAGERTGKRRRRRRGRRAGEPAAGAPAAGALAAGVEAPARIEGAPAAPPQEEEAGFAEFGEAPEMAAEPAIEHAALAAVLPAISAEPAPEPRPEPALAPAVGEEAEAPQPTTPSVFEYAPDQARREKFFARLSRWGKKEAG
jgi:hypothetical protein